MQASKTDNGGLESAIIKLRGISPGSQAAIVSIISKLAVAEGVSIGADYRLPIENIGLWLTKLRSERKSEGTIKL